MRTTFSILVSLIFIAANVQAQTFNDLKKKANSAVSKSTSSGLSDSEITKGLKEALDEGVKKGVDQLSKPGGYLDDANVKIPLPPEAQVVEERLRQMGQGALVDDAIVSLNRAAEDAANEAKPLFVKAIRDMTVQDAAGILRGPDDAATVYLDKATRTELEAKFKPIISASLQKVGATTYWNAVFSQYNKIPLVKDVDPDLDEYATQKAIDGLFFQIAQEEKAIREDPSARVTETLKKVFGS
jgi:hypothetical protein